MTDQYENKLMAVMLEMLKKSSGHIEAEAHGNSISISGSATRGFQIMLIDCIIDDMIEAGLEFDDCLYIINLMRKIKEKDKNELR